MSDNIPFEVQTEIILRIPDTKSLIRCRSVSKAWKSVIDSKKFVKAHTLRHQAHNHHLLITTQTRRDIQVNYLSIVDDDTFPHQKHNVFVPDSVKKFRDDSVTTIGTCHGLFCLYEYGMDTAVIWNPSIRKTVEIPLPNVSMSTVFGFGVCPWNLDPKLVKITYVCDLSSLQDDNTGTQVEVFTLSSGGTWRRPLSCSNLPPKSIQFGESHAVVDGFIYWDAIDGGFRKHNVIMSFDLTSEDFIKVNLPDPLAHKHHADFVVSNLKDSLAVVEIEWPDFCHVWQMIGHGYTRSFNKLYSINAPDASIHAIFGFRKSGAPIVDALAIYEPESESIISVRSYMDTLLLVAH